MTANSTLEYFVEDGPQQKNGNLAQVKDNRLQLNVDGRFVETWELMVLENAKIADWLLVFPRYLARGDVLVSPGLPDKPLDELTESEKVEIRESEAYQMLKRFKLPALKAAAKSFSQKITEFSTDPN